MTDWLNARLVNTLLNVSEAFEAAAAGSPRGTARDRQHHRRHPRRAALLGVRRRQARGRVVARPAERAVGGQLGGRGDLRGAVDRRLPDDATDRGCGRRRARRRLGAGARRARRCSDSVLGRRRPQTSRRSLGRCAPCPSRNDVILAVALAVGAILSSVLYRIAGVFDEPAPAWVTLPWALGIAIPLAWRRIAPITSSLIVGLRASSPAASSTCRSCWSATSRCSWRSTRSAPGRRTAGKAIVARVGITAAMLDLAARLALHAGDRPVDASRTCRCPVRSRRWSRSCCCRS